MKRVEPNQTFDFSAGEAADFIGMAPGSFQLWVNRGFAAFIGARHAKKWARRRFGFSEMKHLAVVCALQRAGLELAHAAASAAIMRPVFDAGKTDGFIALATAGNADVQDYAGAADKLADVFARLSYGGRAPESAVVIDLRAIEKALAPVRAAFAQKYHAVYGRKSTLTLTPAKAAAMWAAHVAARHDKKAKPAR